MKKYVFLENGKKNLIVFIDYLEIVTYLVFIEML